MPLALLHGGCKNLSWGPPNEGCGILGSVLGFLFWEAATLHGVSTRVSVLSMRGQCVLWHSCLGESHGWDCKASGIQNYGGFPRVRGTMFGGLYSKDYIGFWGSILGSLFLGYYPIAKHHQASRHSLTRELLHECFFDGHILLYIFVFEYTCVMRVTPLPGCKVICHDLVAAQVYVVLLRSQAFLLRVWPESGAPRRLDVCAPGLELKQEVSTLQWAGIYRL